LKKLDSIQTAYLQGGSIGEIAKQFHLSTRTIYRLTESVRERTSYFDLLCDWNRNIPANILAEKYKYKNIPTLYVTVSKLRKRGFKFANRRVNSDNLLSTKSGNGATALLSTPSK
jgi:hypothetical protein